MLEKVLGDLRKGMKEELPSMPNAVLLRAHKFAQEALDDVLEEMDRRNLRKIEVKDR